MEKVNNTVRAYAQVITFLCIWGIILILSGIFTPLDAKIALQRFPLAITVYVFVGFLFMKWIWRWPVVRWLIKVPDLQGTWEGELVSDWKNPETGKSVPPIPVTVVIKQTFNTICCYMYTKESSSYSTAAQINIDHGDLMLSYSYTNRPRGDIRERSAIHDGAAVVKVISAPTRSLKGDYWTSRKTSGTIEVKYHSATLAEGHIE